MLQAGAMAAGGEVFVLDLGDPVRIYDLARDMIELSGYSVRDGDNPDGDIEVTVSACGPAKALRGAVDRRQPAAHASHAHHEAGGTLSSARRA